MSQTEAKTETARRFEEFELPPPENGLDLGPPAPGWKRHIVPYGFMAPALLLVAAVFVYPIASGFWTSLHRRTLLDMDGPFVGFDNWEQVITSPAFENSFRVSVVFVVGAILGGLVLAMTFAHVLYYMRFGKSFARTVSLAPWLLSGIAAAWIFRFYFNTDAGLVNELTGLFGYEPSTWIGHAGGFFGERAMFVLVVVQIWSAVPFGTLILLGGLHMVDTDLYEAASLDGAGSWRIFRFVTLPQLWPHISNARRAELRRLEHVRPRHGADGWGTR